MPVITINGPIGGGANELGVRVAEMLSADYVDRMVFAEAAKRIGSTIGALTEKEQRLVRLKDRIAYFLQNMLEKSAIPGEPYFGPGVFAEPYATLAQEPITEAQQLSDNQFIEVTSAVIRELATAGNVVIIGRGANIILKDLPRALHVGLSASPGRCVETIIRRERYGREEAQKHSADTEKARQAFFRKFFKVHPDTPSLYHLCLNMDRMKVDAAADIVVHAVRDLEG